MTSFKKALFFSIFTQQSNLLISFFSIAIIARILSPTEIGVFSVTSFVFVIATEIRSFGTNQYIIREAELNSLKLRTALGIMMITCWTLAALIFIFSPYIAGFYALPDIQFILWILSLSFLIAPFASVTYAQMVRDMHFDRILKIRICGSFTRATSSILLALYGFSYYSLAWGVLIGALAELATILYFSQHKIVYLPSLKLWKNIIKFGAYTSISGLLQKAQLSLPDIVLGKVSTMENVGLFSRGFGLINFLDKLLTLAVKPLILPYLSKIKRDEGDISEAYLRCTMLHSSVAMPAFACAAVLSLPLLRFFFGEQWDSAAPVASILAVWAIMKSTHNFLPDVLIAMGHENILARKEIAIAIIMLIAIVIGAPHGIEVTAKSLLVCGAIDFLLSATIAKRYLSLTIATMTKAIFPNLALTLIVYACSAMIYKLVSTKFGYINVIAITGSLSILLWLITLRIFNHQLWPHILNTACSALSRFR